MGSQQCFFVSCSGRASRQKCDNLQQSVSGTQQSLKHQNLNKYERSAAKYVLIKALAPAQNCVIVIAESLAIELSPRFESLAFVGAHISLHNTEIGP